MPQNKIIIEKDALEKLYSEHGSLNKVAVVLKVSAKTIKRRMKELGLEYEPKLEYTCNHNYFSTHGPAQAYWAGFLITDGCVMERNYSHFVNIGLATKDEDHLEKFKAVVSSTAPIHVKVTTGIIFPGKTEPSEKEYSRSSITVTSKQMFDDLIKYNVVSRKTYICSFPEWLVSDQCCAHFIRGIMDGDGWVSIKKDETARIGFAGTYALLSKIKEIIDTKVLGEVHGFFGQKSEHTYNLEYSGNKIVEKLIAYLYNDSDSSVWLNRKKVKIDKILIDCKPYIGLDLQKEELEQSYKKHGTIAGVAKELGHAQDVIKKYMAQHNLDWNKTTGWEQNHSYFHTDNESPEQYYWAGYLLGNCTIDNHTFIVSSAGLDKLERFRAAGITGSPITTSKAMHRLSFTSEQIEIDLKDKFNITPEKKLKYLMPQCLIDHSYLNHFLRGRIEVRATLKEDLKQLELTGPVEYLEQIRDVLVAKCGLNCYPSIGTRTGTQNNRMSFTGKTVKEILKWI